MDENEVANLNNKVEYHIGGFLGSNYVLKHKSIQSPLPPFSAIKKREGKTSGIFIDADSDQAHKIKRVNY